MHVADPDEAVALDAVPHVVLHVQVNPEMHVDRAHDISYRIEEAIKSGISGVTDVVVHIEPKRK